MRISYHSIWHLWSLYAVTHRSGQAAQFQQPVPEGALRQSDCVYATLPLTLISPSNAAMLNYVDVVKLWLSHAFTCFHIDMRVADLISCTCLIILIVNKPGGTQRLIHQVMP